MKLSRIYLYTLLNKKYGHISCACGFCQPYSRTKRSGCTTNPQLTAARRFPSRPRIRKTYICLFLFSYQLKIVFKISSPKQYSINPVNRITAAPAVSTIIIAAFFIVRPPRLVHMPADAGGAAPSLCSCGEFRSTCQSSSGISARAFRSQVSKARDLGCPQTWHRTQRSWRS